VRRCEHEEEQRHERRDERDDGRPADPHGDRRDAERDHREEHDELDPQRERLLLFEEALLGCFEDGEARVYAPMGARAGVCRPARRDRQDLGSCTTV
jgi:hypothetical protein